MEKELSTQHYIESCSDYYSLSLCNKDNNKKWGRTYKICQYEKEISKMKLNVAAKVCGEKDTVIVRKLE